MKPHDIEMESFRIIEELVNPELYFQKGYYNESGWPVVRRMIHACGDVDIASTVRITSDAVPQGIAALKRGVPVICDVEMVRTGLSPLVKNYSEVHCFIKEDNVVREATELGETRARRALFKAAQKYPEGIYLIGNAPTALLTLLELVKGGKMTPALVVGIPVGFVMAAESKEMLENSGLPYITNLGFKGGTPMTVAAMNAVAKMAG